MKEHPILFSGPMVTAILEGRKTQTRRVVKPQPMIVIDGIPIIKVEARPGEFPIQRKDIGCPYGKPGDRLWVRETFSKSNGAIVYRADGELDDPEVRPWSPSIFMPRTNSRITLEIANVRVERLQEISEADAIAEGRRQLRDGSGCYAGREGPRNLVTPWPTAAESFADGWDVINGKRKGCDWNSNPWVWVIEFKRTKSERSSE